MKNHSALVHFDWAVKRLLRNKSNFVVLEGFFVHFYWGKRYVLSKCWKAKATRIVSMINSTG